MEVLAGRQSTVTVQVQEPAPRIDVPFAGTLVVPTEWNLAEFTLGFDLLDVALGGWDGRFSIDRSGMRAEDDPPTTYRWHSPGAQPGRYSVQLRELTFTVEIEVGEGGLSDARIEVPSPAEVRVRCVDAGTGSDVTDGELSWNCVRQVGGTCNSARWDAELDRWTFRAPIGEIVLDPSVPGYDFQWQTVRVEPGINDFVLRLVRSTGLTPILMDGKDEIAWDDDAMLTLVAAEGQQDSLSSSSGGGRITLFKREPGLYRLKVPDIPGYEPVPEALVHLEKGVIQEYVIELRRSP